VRATVTPPAVASADPLLAEEPTMVLAPVPVPEAKATPQPDAPPLAQPEAQPEDPPQPRRRRLETPSKARPSARLPSRAARIAAAPPVAPPPVATNPATTRAARTSQTTSSTRERVGTSAGERESWLVLLVIGAAAIAAVRIAPDLPELIRQVGAVVVTTSLAWGLAVRTGGRPIWATLLAALLAGGAIASDKPDLLAGGSVATGALAATLAVMMTMPAATFQIVIREVLVATAIAWLGALGVVGYGMDKSVDVDRFSYVVLGLSLAGAFALVYRLGAGLHGLGRRGYVVGAGAVALLVLALVYSEAIAHYGSRDLVGTGDNLRDWTKSTIGAVPHPIVAVLGYPALAWGVFMRARRRQGWWVCAFGIAATAPTATRLVVGDTGFQSCALGAAYSLVIGLVVGYLVIRVEQSFTGTHGRRARRDEEAVAHRPEPRRTRPLH
jgi:hypothetical protein